MSGDAAGMLAILIPVCEWLERNRYRYQIGGSFASSLHGVPRQTRDVDVVVELPESAAGPLVGAFSSEFYVDEDSVVRAVRTRRSFNLVHLATGLKIDVFVAGGSPFDEIELQRSVEMTLDDSGRKLPVKSAEDIILRKLLWYEDGGSVSTQQWSDVLGVMKLQRDILDRAHLEEWSARLGVHDALRLAMSEAWD